jgi:hypothetical protein
MLKRTPENGKPLSGSARFGNKPGDDESPILIFTVVM